MRASAKTAGKWLANCQADLFKGVSCQDNMVQQLEAMSKTKLFDVQRKRLHLSRLPHLSGTQVVGKRQQV